MVTLCNLGNCENWKIDGLFVRTQSRIIVSNFEVDHLL